MVFKWRDSHVTLFLERFQVYECMWNTKSKSYRDRNQRDNAIRSLKDDLNIEEVTEEDIKLKINSIRTRYSYELAKVKKSTKSGCSMAEIYVPKLFWFAQADTFLNAVCTSRDSSSNLDIESNVEQQHDENSDPNLYQDNNSNNLEQPRYNDNSSPSQQISAVNNINGTRPHATTDGQSTPSTSQAPRRFQRGKKRCNEMPIDRAIKQLKEINDHTNKEDEFELFCRSLAVQLRAMPLQRALLCQEKLQSVMVQERLQSMIVQSPGYSEVISSSRSTSSRRNASDMSNYSEQSYTIQSPPPPGDSRTSQQTSYALQLASRNSQRGASEMSNYSEQSYTIQSPPPPGDSRTSQQTSYALQLASRNSQRGASEMSNYSEQSYTIQSPPPPGDSRTSQQTSYALQLASRNSQRGASEMSNYSEHSYTIQSPPPPGDSRTSQHTSYALQLVQQGASEMSNYNESLHIVQSPPDDRNYVFNSSRVIEDSSEVLLQIAIRSITD